MTPRNFETVPVSELTRRGLQREPNGHRRVVLVVDDEQVIADSLCAILRREGFAAFAAYDGESALDVARVIPPELLISDVMMPGMNGIELAIAIRQAVPDCRILLFSGQASTFDLLAQARAEGHDFALLTKPVHPKDLLAHISGLGVTRKAPGEDADIAKSA